MDCFPPRRESELSPRRFSNVMLNVSLWASAMFCLTGCTLGPREIQAGRLRYNESIQKTFQEEMLLNLVRLKYREAPEFLVVGGVAAQYSFDGRAALGGDVNELAPDALGIDGSIARSERPTITYAPQRSESFSRGLLSPISIDSLAFVARTGWRADRILRLTVQEMNLVENARSAGGPTPENKPDFEGFWHLAGVFRDLQSRRLINLAQSERPTREEVPLPIEQLNGDFASFAIQNGYDIKQEADASGQERIYLTKKEQFAALVVHPDALYDPAVLGLCEMLRLQPGCTVYEVEAATKGQIQSAFPDEVGPDCNYGVHRLPAPNNLRKDITISTRSLLEMMFYLSHAIEAPSEHVEKGLVTVAFDEAGQYFDWRRMTGDLLLVHSCKHRPKSAAVAIKYKGYWFYVDDSDLNSQSTFQLLLELFSIEIRGGGGQRLPVLTLGV